GGGSPGSRSASRGGPGGSPGSASGRGPRDALASLRTRDVGVAADPEPEEPVDRPRDADAAAHADREAARARGPSDHEPAPREVGAVVPEGDGERLGELARPVRETDRLGGDAAPPSHRPGPRDRPQR